MTDIVEFESLTEKAMVDSAPQPTEARLALDMSSFGSQARAASEAGNAIVGLEHNNKGLHKSEGKYGKWMYVTCFKMKIVKNEAARG